MRRYSEITYPSFYAESPLQMFPRGLSQGLLFEPLQLCLPGFPTALIILLDSLLELCRSQSERVTQGIFLRRGLERSPHPLSPTMALSVLDSRSAPGGFSPLARDQLPHS